MVLSFFGFRIAVAPAISQSLVQVKLDQPVMANSFQSHFFARRGQSHPVMLGIIDEFRIRQMLDHFRRSGRGLAHFSREIVCRDGLLLFLQLVYGLDVILNSLAEYAFFLNSHLSIPMYCNLG